MDSNFLLRIFQLRFGLFDFGLKLLCSRFELGQLPLKFFNLGFERLVVDLQPRSGFFHFRRLQLKIALSLLQLSLQSPDFICELFR